MDNVISISAYTNPWKEVFSIDSESSTLQIYVNERTGEAEVVQMNDDGAAIRTQLSSVDFSLLMDVMNSKRATKERKSER